MLDRLDTLIAFATVMLGVSLLITILNQMIAGLLGYRATYMKDGIKDLLNTLDSSLGPNVEAIVNDVLTHKLASDSIFAHQEWAPQRWKMATAIRPEELAKLLSLVSIGKPYAATINNIINEINPTLSRQAAMVNQLTTGSTPSVNELIKKISTSTTTAVSRLEAGFNSTMDRVRQRFTLQMRIWTIVFSAVFAIAYHLDAKRIYSQLSTDPALRASLSNASNDLMKSYTQLGPTPAGAQGDGQKTKGAQTGEDLKADTDKLSDAYKEVRGKLADSDLALFDVPQPWYRWESSEIIGILMMIGFLSLGAPFWYNTLKNLVNLRSQVAQKQSEESTK